MSKKIKLGTILSPDTFFYTIPFDQPGQRVTREMLTRHFPEPKGRRAHMGIHTEYKAFKNGLISVEVKTPNNSENMLFLHIGLTELDVACTCGMPEGKLCYHGYMGLYSIAWLHYLELDRFYWPGISADDSIRNKFLITDIHKDWISVKPKPLYGNIFKSALGFKGDKYLSIKQPSGTVNTVSGGKEAIAYCLAYNVGNQSNSHLPLLIPCLGITSKSNKEMVSFKQFGRQDKPITNIVYTSNQQQLNDISFQQYDILKRINSSSGEGKNHEMVEAKQAMLTLWEQVIPLLLNEKYNYRYYTYWLRYLKDKPRKTDMRDCKYSLERPVLSFLLKFHQDHFSLKAIVSVNGNALKFDYKPHLFVFDDITGLCYLMATVQDDNLLMWMLSNNRRLTVMKEHFIEFHDTFLAKLNTCYTVSFTDPISKKTVPYSFELVTDQIIKQDDYGN
jgi:hypothetical protein